MKIWKRVRDALSPWRSKREKTATEHRPDSGGDRHLGLARESLEELLADSRVPESVREELAADYAELQTMLDKLSQGHIHVAVLGRVGVGKSSLLNALIGAERFAVSPLHGETRDTAMAGWRELGDGGVYFIDTPGLDEVHGESREKLAREAANRADLVLFVVDADLTASELEALKAVALSGVDVKLMFTPSGTTYSIPYYAANTYFKEVAEAGAKIYLYQAGYFHPKTLNVDGRICTIGTANMDIRSFSLNYEGNAVIYDQAQAQELEQAFINDLDLCTEWTLEEYLSRSFGLRLRDSLSRLASPLL